MAETPLKTAGGLKNLGLLIEAAVALVDATKVEVRHGRGRGARSVPTRPGLVTWRPGRVVIEKAEALIKVAKDLDALPWRLVQ